MNDDSVTWLRENGYCVVIFNPDELESANPNDVHNALVEYGWEIIQILSEDEIAEKSGIN